MHPEEKRRFAVNEGELQEIRCFGNGRRKVSK